MPTPVPIPPTPTPVSVPGILHVDSDPFIFAYPGSDCDLGEALTNLIGLDEQWGTQDDCCDIVWGTEIHPLSPLPDGEESWLSYSASQGAGWLGIYGLEEGKPYVLTHDDCVCTDWEMCQ